MEGGVSCDRRELQNWVVRTFGEVGRNLERLLNED